MSQRRTLSFIMILVAFLGVGCRTPNNESEPSVAESELTQTMLVPTPIPLPHSSTPFTEEGLESVLSPTLYREDGAFKVNTAVRGSLQNPAWSPDSQSLLFTRFNNGYNMEPADLSIIDLGSGAVRTLISDGSGNINLPGSSWQPLTGQIIFSSSREPHDEIFVIDDYDSSGDEIKVTSRANMVSYEPSFSADGQWVVFESHKLDVEDNGIITKYRLDGTEPFQDLTSANTDSRQPNWSQRGDKIVYQKFIAGQWDIWIMDADGTNQQQVTSGLGDKTDVSFSPDGQWLVYSSDELGLEFANLFILPLSGGNPMRLTRYEGYDGAPSWSGDGKWIAFESYKGDPDDSPGTTIWIIEVPDEIQTKLFK